MTRLEILDAIRVIRENLKRTDIEMNRLATAIRDTIEAEHRVQMGKPPIEPADKQ